MSSSATTSFFERFPGPYSVQPSTDGVDNTFEVICQSTDGRIIAAAYWYEEEQAKLIADIVTLALELSRPTARRATAPVSMRRKLKSFESLHPGPYICKEHIHDEGMAEIGVASLSQEVMVISTLTVPGCGESLQVARQIATALNRLFRHPYRKHL